MATACYDNTGKLQFVVRKREKGVSIITLCYLKKNS